MLMATANTRPSRQGSTPPTNTTNPDAFTKEWMDERYAGMTRDQMVDQMKADGFGYDPVNRKV